MKNVIFEWIKTIVIAFAAAFLINVFITPLQVHSVSMNPTLVENDYLILNDHAKIERGDIVSFTSDIPFEEYELQSFNFIEKFQAGDTKNLIKRVIALPGDQLQIYDGKVYLNGELQEEPYILGDFTFGDIYIEEIPEGEIFVMGDNRDNSLDSRSFGTVSIDKVQGRAMVRLFPFNKIGILE